MIFFFSFQSDFFMVVKTEVKNKVVFKSKYEFHSSQIEVKYVLQIAFDFSGFRQISSFLEKKTFETFVVEICVEGCKRLRQEWQQGADVDDLFTIEYCPCFEKIHFPAILRVKRNKTFFLSQLCWSIVTNLRTYYQATHFLIYEKQFSFTCLLSFITSFVSVTADRTDSFLDSFFTSKNAIYNAIKKHKFRSNNFFCEIEKIKERFL